MATDLGVCKQEAECICVSFIVVQDCDKFQSESLVSPTALVSAQNGCLRVMEPWSAAAAPQQRRRHRRRLPRDECQTRCRLSSRRHLKINNINDDFSLLVTSVRAFLEVMPSLCSGCSLPNPPKPPPPPPKRQASPARHTPFPHCISLNSFEAPDMSFNEQLGWGGHARRSLIKANEVQIRSAR